jgi:MFS family permease
MTSVRTWRILLAIVLGLVLIPINSTMVAVALVPIARGVGASVTAVVWMVTVYLAVMAVLQPMSGRLGDLFGHRRLYLTGLSVFLISSVLAASIPHLWAVIVFRGGQAVGGAFMAPNAMAVVRRSFAHERLRRVLSWISLAQGLGAAFGPLIGTVFIRWGGWPAMFWFNIPVLLGSLAASWRWLPADAVTTRPRLDYFGSLLLAALLTCFSLAAPHPSTQKIAPFSLLAAAGLAWAFWRWERRVREPMVQFRLFRKAAFTTANLAILFSNFLMYSTLLYMPLYLKSRHDSPLATGFLLFGFSLSMSFTSWIGGALLRVCSGRRIIAAAFALNLVVVLWYIGLPTYPLVGYIVPGLALAGMAGGISTVAIQSTLLESVSRSHAGEASGIYSTFRYLGSISASALVGTMMLSNLGHWLILLVAALAGLTISQRVPAASKMVA